MTRAKLRWTGTRIGSFTDGRACLIVQFLDPQGNLLEWVPMWSQVTELVDRATNTEVVNKPDSAWLSEFARTAHSVFNKVELLGDARIVEGTFDRLENGNLHISYFVDFDEHVEEIPPAFQLTQDFLDEWLRSRVRVLVINGYGVNLSRVVRREVPKDPFGFAFGSRETVVRDFIQKYPVTATEAE